MTSSIFEHSDGASLVVLTNQDGEHHAFDLAVGDSHEDAGLSDSESVLEYLVFSYSLLGEPNAKSDDEADDSDSKDAVEEYDSIDEHSFAGI
jgi:hypothetical protein